jgi:hypothetical protein
MAYKNVKAQIVISICTLFLARFLLTREVKPIKYKMPSKKFGFIFFCLVISLSPFAQKALLDKIENADASTYKPFTIGLDTRKKYSSFSHFKFIRVIDGRSNQSKLGITRAGEKTENRRFIFPKEFTSYLQEKLKKLCDPEAKSKDTAVFVINNLWLYQTLEPGSSIEQQALGVSNNWISNCFLNIDCFMVKNNRYDLFCRIDTIITLRGWLPNECSHILAESFSLAISYAESMFLKERSSAPEEMSEDEFKNLLLSRFHYPILTATKFSTGIFQTYEDFLGNKVYPMEVEVYYQKNKRLIKSKTLADSVPLKSWGFSDRENLFLNVDGASYSVSAPLIDPLLFLEPSHHTVETFELSS